MNLLVFCRNGIEERLVFSTDNVKFRENGDLELKFFGIKYDMHRDCEAGFDPDKVRRISMWKTLSVFFFFEHYVYDKTHSSYSDSVLL